MNTTQNCKKCNVEKPLTEYHRRGPGHQRICKECRNAQRRAYVPNGGGRVIFFNPPELYAPLAKRIESLESRLRAKARSYAKDQMEADDIYGAMITKILEKSKPTDSDSRILTRATWAAQACVRQYRTYLMMVETESVMLKSSGGESHSAFDRDFKEMIICPSPSAEEEFLHREQVAEVMQKLSALPREYQVIISLLSFGHNQHEIAQKLQKSDQAVSSAIKNIANQLSNLGLSPQTAFAM